MLGQLNKEELADLYAGALAVAVTSRWYEGFPLAVVEAMYYGAPVVVPDLAGLPQIVDYGRCGAVYTSGSASALAACLSRLADDPQLADELGRCSRERTRRQYSADIYYRLLIENAR